MIPREKIDELLNCASIVQIISEHTTLRKSGANHSGLCPFHSEKTASFSVSEDKKLFYCFGCHAGGNVIDFIMQKEGLSFPDAVRSLAQRYGITIEEQGRARNTLTDAIYEANELAFQYFKNELFSAVGSVARDYIKGRGLSKETVEAFGLGFAPEGWRGLTEFLKKKGVKPEVAMKAGLAAQKNDNIYDRFRARVIFPIRDASGRCLAFGGRAMGDDKPKYLNSAESPIFKKSDVLYGIHEARSAISKAGSALVAEGYMDTIALHAAGFTNTVATMGTALTPGHVKRLSGYSRNILTIFDGDDAGRKAALRSVGLFLDEDLPALVVLLPKGMDPDDLLKEGGQRAMKALIDKAVPVLDFLIDEAALTCNLATPGGKRELFDKILPFLKRIRNPAEEAHYVEAVAGRLSMRPDSVYEAVRSKRGIKQTPSRDESPDRAQPRSPIGVGGDIRRRGMRGVEEVLLRVLLHHPELYDQDVKQTVASFKDETFKKAMIHLTSRLDEGIRPGESSFDSAIEDEGVRVTLAALLLARENGFIESPEQMLDDCVEKLLAAGKLKSGTLEQIRLLEESGRMDAADAIRARAMQALELKGQNSHRDRGDGSDRGD